MGYLILLRHLQGLSLNALQLVEELGDAKALADFFARLGEKIAGTKQEKEVFRFQLASFFRFMAVNLNFPRFVTWAMPR